MFERVKPPRCRLRPAGDIPNKESLGHKSHRAARQMVVRRRYVPSSSLMSRESVGWRRLTLIGDGILLGFCKI